MGLSETNEAGGIGQSGHASWRFQSVCVSPVTMRQKQSMSFVPYPTTGCIYIALRYLSREQTRFLAVFFEAEAP